MMRSVRSLRAHLGPVLVLALGAAVAVAGTFVVVTTLAGGGRTAVALPLALLALVVLPLPALELARHRRGETTLVRVRGASLGRLLADVASQAVAAVLVGGALGLALGLGVVGALRARWDLRAGLDPTALGWAGAVVAGAVVVVTAVAAVVAREPLATALHRPTWRRTPGLGDLVAGVGLLVASVAVVLLALGDEPGDLVLAGPAVLGVAVGHVLVIALRAGVPATLDPGRSTAVVLALRRAASADLAGRLRAVTAAGVVVVAALSATSSAGAWADSSARLQQGGPVRVALPEADALSALLLTRALDPEGRWLMAAAVAAEREETRLRIAWLDLERSERVTGDFLDSTPADLRPAVAALRTPPPVEVVTGERLAVERGTTDGEVTLTLTLVGDAGAIESVTVLLADGSVDGSTPVEACERACVVTGISASGPVDLRLLRLDAADLLDTAWTAQDGSDPQPPGPLSLDATTTLVPGAATAAAPVLTTDDPAWEATGPAVPGIGGGSRAVVPTGTRRALPLVEGAGVVMDLPVALAGSRGSVSDVTVMVLARPDTPDDVLAALRSAGGSEPTLLGATELTLGGPALAERRARTALAAAATLLGLIALLAGTRRRTRVERRHLAALRLLGLPPADLRRVGLLESVSLGLVVAVVLGATGWLVAVTVVDAGGLVPSGPTRLGSGSAVTPGVLVLGAVATAVALVAGTALVRGLARRRSAPATLLEEPR